MESIVINYDNLNVLEDFSLKGETKQFICLFGPSGIGKTTILNVLAGILKPDYGKITLDNERVAYVFQEPRLPPWMTVEQNIEVGLYNLIRDVRRRKKIVQQVLPKIGLEYFGEYYPEQLSGGMKQRVSIGRAFVIQPDLLLLDEPFSGLDEALKIEMQDLILTLENWHMCTTVMVTHDIQEAFKLSDRIVVVGGRPCRIILDIMMNPKDRRDPKYKNELEGKIISALHKNNKREMEHN
ncbi:ABC transporter ATP-binding protein [Alkalibaculum bacchi]|uniref:ABC transporter ATP-binding protein n=1 Tax=Alkalibaculum bacchi TaxID=645887 RepID=UPI0026E9648B|nr:ABC transporter ATP-binding protein [Alkalibaculum bacchi]